MCSTSFLTCLVPFIIERNKIIYFDALVAPFTCPFDCHPPLPFLGPLKVNFDILVHPSSLSPLAHVPPSSLPFRGLKKNPMYPNALAICLSMPHGMPRLISLPPSPNHPLVPSILLLNAL
jgi:hypothetical protein